MDDNALRITAVVLAAGQSQRMGQAKLLLPWGTTTIVGQTLAHVQAADVADVLLVSGGYRAAVEAIAHAQGVSCIHNPHFATGELLSSLQTAVRHLVAQPQPPAAVLIMLADLPFIPPGVMNEITAAFRAGRGALIAPVCNGQRGHPTLIGQALFAALLALPPTAAPRDLFRQQSDQLYTVPIASDIILRDIDTPEEYTRWRP